jgi:hypothetical protein
VRRYLLARRRSPGQPEHRLISVGHSLLAARPSPRGSYAASHPSYQHTPHRTPTTRRLPLVAVYRMAATTPPYARPEIVRGQQCAEAPLSRQRSDPAAAWRCSPQSRALAGGLTAEPSWLPSAARAAHSNTVRRPSGVVVPGCPDATVPWSPCRVLRQRPRVRRPPVQYPVRVSVRPSGVRASGVRCPGAVSGVSVRHPCVSRPCPRCPHR